jgi:DNA repair exonuclease SbcCD ATPase subunit
MEKSKCCVCGFECIKGQNGSHSCADHVKQDLYASQYRESQLRQKLGVEVEKNALLKISANQVQVAQNSIEALKEQLRAANEDVKMLTNRLTESANHVHSLEAAIDERDQIIREARDQKPLGTIQSADAWQLHIDRNKSALPAKLGGNVYADPVPAMPIQDDKSELAKHFEFAMESKEFEKYAIAEKMNMHMHPLHYLFLDRRTSTARDAWRSAMNYAVKVLAGNQSKVKPSC